MSQPHAVPPPAPLRLGAVYRVCVPVRDSSSSELLVVGTRLLLRRSVITPPEISTCS